MSDSESNLLHCDCGCTSIPTPNRHRCDHNRSSPSSTAPQLRKAVCPGISSSSSTTGVNVGLLLPNSRKEETGLQDSRSLAVGGRGAGSAAPIHSATAESSVDKEGDLTHNPSSLVALPGGGEGDGGGVGGDNNNHSKLATSKPKSNSYSRRSPPGSINISISSSPSSSGFCSYCASKMLTCRVLIALLLVKCLILSFIIPAHLIPASSSSPGTSSEYPPHEGNDYDGGSNGNGNGHHSHSAGDEDGFDNIIMLEDQPLSLMSEMKSEILNLVEPFDLHSQAVTNPDTEDTGGATTEKVNGDGDGDGDGNDDDNEVGSPGANGDGDGETSQNGSETNGKGSSSSEGGSDSDGDGDDDKDDGGEDAAGEGTESGTGNASSEGSASVESTGSCSMKAVLAKIEGLMDAIKNIDNSIDKMETLVQTTMIDERVYKCLSAIGNGNQTQALKYWKQILRYLPTPQKQAAILNQIIRDAYSGSEDQILPVIQFISQTTHYYGYHTLFNELTEHDHLYRNTAVFTLGHHIKKSCGADSPLYKSLPSAVQSVFGGFFTLQNKHNKGYLYYAKRCVAKHYFHCLDVLTKRIDPYVLDGLADDSEEKKRYHWKLNATDSTVTKFFILNHDKYWTYRLQDLNNSPRFKMEEAGSNAEVDLAHFQLKLHTDDELMIQVRDSEDYLEEEDFKSDKAEVRLHSFHQADGIPDSPRMYWLANPVTSSSANGDEVVVDDPDSCNMDLALISPANGNGNGGRK